jgi:hypothetical protein
MSQWCTLDATSRWCRRIPTVRWRERIGGLQTFYGGPQGEIDVDQAALQAPAGVVSPVGGLMVSSGGVQ